MLILYGTRRQPRLKGQVLADSSSEESSTPRRSERQPVAQANSTFDEETDALFGGPDNDSSSEDEDPVISENESDT